MLLRTVGTGQRSIQPDAAAEVEEEVPRLRFERRAIAACAAEGAAIEAVWSAGARASIGDAFAATGRPAAAETLGRTLVQIDVRPALGIAKEDRVV